MWRSHTACLEVPLRQPITGSLRAQQLPGPLPGPGAGAAGAAPPEGGGAPVEAPIALHLQLQASPDSPVTVRDIQLAPQLGLTAHPAYPAPTEWLLPLRLEAGGAAGVTFMLQRGRGEPWAAPVGCKRALCATPARARRRRSVRRA
jgi:hypothetical protein